MIGLCDCNSFFASSEKVFRPDLKDKPVVVLSNNDGIVVALDQKAKDLGLKRGDAWFEVRDLALAKGVVPFSSNYTLYQNLSDRVMNTLATLSPEIEPYSIDEAFFLPPPDKSPEEIRRIVTQGTGVPVSVGIGRTRTLTKIASKKAKKTRDGAFLLDEGNEEEVLASFPVEDVWGVGWSWRDRLQKKGIRTAKALRDMDDDYLRKTFNICLLRTALELRGIDAHREGETNVTVRSGISFSEPVFKEEDMEASLCLQAQTLSEKLLEKGLQAKTFGVNFFTSRFSEDWRSPYAAVRLLHPTAYAPDFMRAVRFLTPYLFQEGGRYKGCRVFAFDLTQRGDREIDLFLDEERIEREEQVSLTVGEVERKYGRNVVQSAACLGRNKADLMRREMKSPYYTTRFSELAEVY